MKVKNISQGSLFLNDLWAIREAQNQGRRGEARYLAPGAEVYLPNTSEVLRSAATGHIKQWKDAGFLELEDTDTLNGGASLVLSHGLGYAPAVYCLRRLVGPPVTWVDGVGTYDAVHNADFTTTTITNTTGGVLTFMIRLL